MRPLLSWDLLQAIIGGNSALDLPRLHVSSRADAHDFVRCYGFDWDIDGHRREAETIRSRACSFIERELLTGGSVPDQVRDQRDVREIVLWASSPDPTSRQRWACALLRVMHAVAHCNFPLQDRYGSQIRTQILDRFHPHLHSDEHGQLLLGDGPDAIPLVDFQAKEAKPLDSTVLKLLHKVENVATAIFDHVGVRFVTQDRLDALQVVRYLRRHNVFMLANVKPARSRNNLVDLGRLADALEVQPFSDEASRERWVRDNIGAFAPDHEDRASLPKEALPPRNPFSSTAYHSIQFTCRQLIRVPDPADPSLELRFFFPYEVQVLDVASYEEARSGRASHEVYRERQRRAVVRRVLGTLAEDGGGD